MSNPNPIPPPAAPKGTRHGGGRPKGQKNKATLLRQQGVIDAAEHAAARQGLDVRKMTPLQRLTTLSDLMWSRLSAELNKGERANQRDIMTIWHACLRVDSQAANYVHPRLAVHKFVDPNAGLNEPVRVTLIADGTVTKLIDGEVVERDGRPVNGHNGGGR